ncbi:uncharacterized protein L969DRAFT_620281 [Mixia osmundae IAM 14324]|uniref:Fcf2 pre-rRNA processing C-terminal domain-containing protein n=1 Tax=Mixia osmundae (strain CBS 9802 / IAM 14324 / JCM 22182 / KY 12970) TaxID=764103 RepID=G7E8S3_MIXOS|nr:uncharacterized protein L969DRAFT_620281 [Mixia osmundae IAM 14324]KEI40177.1 hypothetical protein L969DRAFT_620281 [Mixia osmundae IAM 14324]GAA99541.1 hypothetical protein E5Q_06242 [Mixia osmundae IAM 14324]
MLCEHFEIDACTGTLPIKSCQDVLDDIFLEPALASRAEQIAPALRLCSRHWKARHLVWEVINDPPTLVPLLVEHILQRRQRKVGPSSGRRQPRRVSARLQNATVDSQASTSLPSPQEAQPGLPDRPKDLLPTLDTSLDEDLLLVPRLVSIASPSDDSKNPSDDDDEDAEAILERARAKYAKKPALALSGRTDLSADILHLDSPDDPKEIARRRLRALLRPLTSSADVYPSEQQLDVKGKGRAIEEPSEMPAVRLRDKWGEGPVKLLTTAEKAKLKRPTAGPGWFDMTAPEMTPELKREIQAMQLHNALDPKRFMRGESKRAAKKLPEIFQFGHILPSTSRTPLTNTGGPVAMPKKRTFLEQLVQDENAKTYAKKKFLEVQARSQSGGKKFYQARTAARKRPRKI